ncbi:MAG: hypothetical protein GTO53_07255 [Planctomycetales bacterium]|nr:hypothetical protein [Planctomycetales bacterium]NIM08933.1 hypothetical protein [Planctomycetales bacterium]NIN08403.1 hypothetical protein [Planctomycetales bacterium]NIN77531.1 hypothetical protein [Planctomycetales bacterium]NIO34703.1 hypothetical protein [Planctomycetales bacterium]
MIPRRLRRHAEWLPGVMLIALLGCNSQVSPQTSRDEDPSAPDRRSPSPVQVRVTDGAGYRALLKGHLGQVVLVDFWALW